MRRLFALVAAGATIDGASLDAWNTGVVDRIFYYQVGGYAVPVPVPGTGRVIATRGAPCTAMLESGDVYVYYSDPASVSAWRYEGNLLGAPPIQVGRESFGRIKAR